MQIKKNYHQCVCKTTVTGAGTNYDVATCMFTERKAIKQAVGDVIDNVCNMYI